MKNTKTIRTLFTAMIIVPLVVLFLASLLFSAPVSPCLWIMGQIAIGAICMGAYKTVDSFAVNSVITLIAVLLYVYLPPISMFFTIYWVLDFIPFVLGAYVGNKILTIK